MIGVTPGDLTAFTAAPDVLAVVALVAVWLPARWASRADPMTASDLSDVPLVARQIPWLRVFVEGAVIVASEGDTW